MPIGILEAEPKPAVAKMGKLRSGTVALAIRLQEAMDAGDALSAGDIRCRLSDAIGDMYRDSGHWGYYIDHFGDDESGDVIYSCDGDTWRAPYEMADTSGASKCLIDTDNAESVVPRTIYEVEADEEDDVASMESLRTAKLYAEVPVYERFVSKKERNAADSSDFAGKGKSFPILKAADVAAAASSLGRAGSDNYDADTIKANIIRIAKRKGFALPKAWQNGSKESAPHIRLSSMIARLKEAGARHSVADKNMIQSIHDTANSLGADCAKESTSTSEAAKPMMDCPDCDDASGKCPDCNGLGKSGDKDCPTCGGDGDCPTCDGDGEVPISYAQESRKGVASVAESSQSTSSGTSGAVGDHGTGLRLVEGAAFCDEIKLTEAIRTTYPILVINAGTGTTAHYPADVLKREAAKFKPGTLMFWNHPTLKEESERPEGDLNNLAAILTSTGSWREDGPKGPGIYAEAKVMADYAEKVGERAPYIGLSIRAGGSQDGDRTIDGRPVLKEFTHIESVDYVTKAGRGGMALAEAARNAGILQESARAAEINTQEAGMPISEEELKVLKESQARLLERAVYQDAIITARNLLDEMSLPPSAKSMVVENVLGSQALGWKPIPTTDGHFDTARFTESLNFEAKRIGKMLAQVPGATGPIHMGAGYGLAEPQSVESVEAIAAREATAKREEEGFARIMESIMGAPEAAKHAAKGRAA